MALAGTRQIDGTTEQRIDDSDVREAIRANAMRMQAKALVAAAVIVIALILL